MISNLNSVVYKLDKFTKRYNNTVNLKQNDIRKFKIAFYENGEELNIENFNIEVRWVNPNNTIVDKLDIDKTIVKKDNTIEFMLDKECTKVPGIAKMEICLTQNGLIDSSWTIEIPIKASVFTGNQEVSKNTSNLLDQLNTANTNTNNIYNKVVSWSNEHQNVDTLITDVNAIKDTKSNDVKMLKNVDISNSGVILYQAEVKNPICADYNEMPIGIKIKFNKGDCLGENYIAVKDNTGNPIPFQIEKEVHPNPLLKENLGSYSDGSLKGVTIWIIGTIHSNATNVYTIEVHSDKQRDSQASAIAYETDKVDTVYNIDRFKTSNLTIEFDETRGYQLKKYVLNGITYNEANNSMFMPYVRDTSSHDIGKGEYDITKRIEGTGVIYYDYIVDAVKKNNTSICVSTRYRIFKNKLIKAKSVFKALNNVSSGSITQFGFKFRIANNPSMTFTNSNADAWCKAVIDSNNALTYRVEKSFLSSSILNNNYYASKNLKLTDQTYVGMNTWLQCPETTTFPKNSYNMVMSYLMPCSEQNSIGMNIQCVHATNTNKVELTNKYIHLCRKYVEHMHTYTFNNYFKGLNEYEKMMWNLLNLNVTETTNINALPNYIYQLQNKYGDITSASEWQNKWKNGTTENHCGIEFIGRDTAPLSLFRNLCVKFNKANSLSIINSTIHALADFAVWLEEYSGGEGKIKLQSYSDDAMNSEATAMKFLYNSLKLEENQDRRACYNRIKQRFESSIEHINILPYSKNNNPIWNRSLLHYHCFSIFEYLQAVDNPCFDIATYINSVVSASGKIDEIGSEYTPARFGFAHTSLYASYILYKYNTLSSLETACKLVENVLNNCYPTGGHMFPIDFWTPVNVGTIDQAIEVQASYKVIEDMLKL